MVYPVQVTSPPQANAEVPVNGNFSALGHQSVYSQDQTTTAALTWGYNGGRWGGFTVADGTFTLAASTTTYISVLRTTGAISQSTATTNWLDTSNYARVYQLTTSASAITATQDHRAGPGGVHGPEMGARVKSVSAAYTTILADANGWLLHPSADTTARTWTIDANATVAYPLGTELRFINQNAAGTLTIGITTDTMRLSPGGTTGSRTLAANGDAVARKIAATEWIISGTGLT